MGNLYAMEASKMAVIPEKVPIMPQVHDTWTCPGPIPDIQYTLRSGTCLTSPAAESSLVPPP